MDKTPSIKKNYIYKLMYEILTMITPFITAPYIARVLGADGVGTYSYTQSYMTYFTMFAALGTSSYGMREIARCRDNKQEYSKKFWEIELITVFTTVICLVCWILTAFLYEEYQVYMLAMTFTLVAVIFDISWLYGGLEEFKYTVGINAIFKIISIVLIFTLIKSKDDLVLYIALMSACTLFGNLSMWLFLIKEILLVKIEMRTLISHLKKSIEYFGPTIAISIYTVLDKTLIGLITHSDSQNGYYEQATKIISIIKSISFSAINGVMTSRASYLFAEDKKEELKKIINYTYQLTTFITVGVCFGIIGISELFVPIFFGEGYEPVVYLLDILSPIILIICLSNVIGSIYYSPAGKMKEATALLTCGSIINLVLNICLIPRLGSYGAAIASIIAETIVTVLFVSFSEGYITWKMIWGYLYKKIVAGIVMLIAIKVVNSEMATIADCWLMMIDIIGGILIYLALLFVLKDNSVVQFTILIRSKQKK